MIRVGFFGTPDLSARVLVDLFATPDFEVVFVVTNPDKPFGRDQVLKSSPVKVSASSRDIPIFMPTKIRENKEFFDILRSFECDYFVVVAYGRILPLELLEIPREKSINIHGSILPKYRGASPIQSALLHGEKETGVTIMNMSEGMDEGDILKIRTILIDSTETSGTLFEKFAEISGPTLIQTLRELETWGITPLPQDDSLATYCKKIEKEDGLIDWKKSADEIYHMWQAYTPWPGIYTMYNDRRLLLEITNYELRITNDWVIGQVVKLEDGTIWVNCGEWILTLERVKLEWKKSQNITDFVNWQKWFIGYKLAHELRNITPSCEYYKQ
jgi:methionyl-tRNA formyltransferase